MTLLELAERVEAAEGPDRDLDALIGSATGARGEYCGPISPELVPAGCIRDPRYPRGAISFRRYTSSLDAAMTLADPEWFWRLGHDGEGPDPASFKAEILIVGAGHFVAVADTPAAALTAACLRARASLTPQSESVA